MLPFFCWHFGIGSKVYRASVTYLQHENVNAVAVIICASRTKMKWVLCTDDKNNSNRNKSSYMHAVNLRENSFARTSDLLVSVVWTLLQLPCKWRTRSRCLRAKTSRHCFTRIHLGTEIETAVVGEHGELQPNFQRHWIIEISYHGVEKMPFLRTYFCRKYAWRKLTFLCTFWLPLH